MSETNGSGPRIQRREAWVELPNEYEGFKFKIWVNAPTKLWLDIGSGDEVVAAAAAQKLVLDTNGWLDFDGQPYPPPSNPAFWEEIPTELAGCVFAAAQKEMGRLPNLIAPQRRRSKSG